MELTLSDIRKTKVLYICLQYFFFFFGSDSHNGDHLKMSQNNIVNPIKINYFRLRLFCIEVSVKSHGIDFK